MDDNPEEVDENNITISHTRLVMRKVCGGTWRAEIADDRRGTHGRRS